ncbi:Ig-like domain repeat protein [Bradyrhizobium erythrophlei]|uniref:Ig-like domain repeat protein n=1 Tax=Bradyrhizobium erythrophlei TaxID=1437360 RepID=UPI0035EB0243
MIFRKIWLALGVLAAAGAAMLLPSVAWAGPATHFQVSAPASATTGASFTLTVTALDAGNAVDTGYTGTVHFTSTDGSAILPTNYFFTPADAGVHTFSATLNTSGSQTVTATDTVSSSITGQSGTISVSSSADLSVTKSGPASVLQGQNATYTITVTNNGPSAAANVSLADALPAGTTFVSFSIPGGWSAITPPIGGTGSVTASIASFASGGTATFTLVAQVAPAATAGSTITNTATVSSTTADPNAANNSSSSSLTVTAPVADLAVTKVGPASVLHGQNATYTITVSNAGPIAAASVSLTDTLPAGMTFVSFSIPGGWSALVPPIGGTGTVTATIASLASGGSATFTLVAQVAASTPGGTTISNTATVSTTTTDPINSNNSSTSSLTVTTPPADLSVTKVGPASVQHGQNATYTITVNNAGPSNAANAQLTDVLPPNTTFVSFSQTTGPVFSASTPAVGGTGAVTASLASLAPGASATFTLVAQVNAAAPAGSAITNTATVSSTSSDPNNANDTANSSLTVTAAPATHFSVSAPAAATAGTAFNITVTALDASNGVATGYAGTVHFTSSDGAAVLPANATLTNGVGTFSVTLNTSGSRTITATDTVTPAITGAANVNVTSNAAAHFVVSAPASATTGVAFNLTVTALDAANTTVTGYTGTVHFTSSDGAAVLPANATLTNGVGTFSVTLNTSGSRTITATDTVTPAITGAASVNVAPVKTATTTTVVSSQNPSSAGQSVAFTATVSGATPTGSVTFSDGSTVLGIVTLAGGVATFATSSLATGNHSITAVYGGDSSFVASTSAALVQTVNTAADSLKLRALQVLVTPIAAQVSGQAISGAVDSAIGEGFGGSGGFISPSGNGVRFNFAADPDARASDTAPRPTDPFDTNGSFAGGRGFASQASPTRIDDAFGALAYAGPTKAQSRRIADPREWLGWAEVRGATLDRWGNLNAVPGATVLYGNQVNLLAGLTRKFTPNFLVGVLGGYETFDYRSDALTGRLKGDGWTVGSYVGWKVTQDIRFDAAVAYSGIGYDGTAGTAAGSFGGNRWLVTSGLTGTYASHGVLIEPSARVYALWERESAYTDSLGTQQGARDFSTGRASGGVKLSYPLAWTATAVFTPYAGLYGDYYFNNDSAGAVAAATAALPANLVLSGWSARASGGLTARFDNGAQIAVGGERSGIGGSFGLWTYRARASVPFSAQ